MLLKHWKCSEGNIVTFFFFLKPVVCEKSVVAQQLRGGGRRVKLDLQILFVGLDPEYSLLFLKFLGRLSYIYVSRFPASFEKRKKYLAILGPRSCLETL